MTALSSRYLSWRPGRGRRRRHGYRRQQRAT